MVVPEILINTYNCMDCIIENYNNCVVVKTEDWLNNPVDYIFTKNPIEDYNIGYNLVMDKCKKIFNTNALYVNSKDYTIPPVHLDSWFGV